MFTFMKKCYNYACSDAILLEYYHNAIPFSPIMLQFQYFVSNIICHAKVDQNC